MGEEIKTVPLYIEAGYERNEDGSYHLHAELSQELRELFEKTEKPPKFAWSWMYSSATGWVGIMGASGEPDVASYMPPADDTDPEVKVILEIDGDALVSLINADIEAKKKYKGEKEKQSKFADIAEEVLKQIRKGTIVLGNIIDLPPIRDVAPKVVQLTRARAKRTDDIGLWMAIKASSENLSWQNYKNAMDLVLSCGKSSDLDNEVKGLANRRSLPFTDTDSYRALKVATEAFLLVNTPTVSEFKKLTVSDEIQNYLKRRTDFSLEEVRSAFRNSYLQPDSKRNLIPYLFKVSENLKGTTAGANAAEIFNSHIRNGTKDKVLGCWQEEETAKLSQPLLIELIWSYWMEEMQLVQSMHAVSRRFQNVQAIGPRDPLAQLDADSLRPLGNLMWGYVQDEQHRLTLARRAYEYSHHYGFSLIGKAVPQLRPADNRSKFIEAFHNLLSLCAQFFRQADDTTVVADGFPVLNALREVHLLLSEGAGNQFRDLPATARVEMLMEQWILARSEFREFLPRRASIAYPEDWMHSVDSMRRLQGWGDTNVLHFWHLATCGERIVSSIRWGNWNEVLEPENASNWANFFRPDIQSYIHAYRAVTGVDITVEPVDSTMPSVHLLRRQSPGALKRA